MIRISNYRKLKKQCKILAKRLADAGYEGDGTKEHKDCPYVSRAAGECVVQRSFSSHLAETISHPSSRVVPHTAESANDSTSMSSTEHPVDNESSMPAIRKKENDYEGMFESRKEDINVIIRHLIIELKPRVAMTILPVLPAYILFMCIRHTDSYQQR